MRRRAGDAIEIARTRRRVAVAALGLLAIGLLALIATVALFRSQRGAQSALETRYASRAALAAAAAGTYAEQLMDGEIQAATANLSGPVDQFGTVVSTFGFTNAVLLDARGRVLAVQPPNRALLGQDIADRYPHLTGAEGGRRAVSPIVPAAADGQPVVGFAVPFQTPSGRRVFSGAYTIRSTPLTDYLRTMVNLPTSRFLLIDDAGLVLATTHRGGPATKLSEVEPALAEAYRHASSGRYDDQFFASSRVDGTPWTVITAVSQDALLAPVRGNGQNLAWGILAALIAMALLAWFLVRRLAVDHGRLQDAYRRLDRLARVDPLTGVQNRRAIGDLLADGQRAAADGATPLSVLMIDVDHFKRINDTFGHVAGDQALIAVAERLQGGLREEDVLGRWGGEEFLVVLPNADQGAATMAAERLRESVRVTPVSVGTGGDEIDVSVSIGIASGVGITPEVLVHTADRALYAAKAAGRDRIHALSPLPAVR
ncbi:MAG: GGDEF domain-containing protein [Frankiaceae bacterium]|nr:GGDEF domain-containing protein [Frankiaceae bacterium]